jgi:hypothetical protein
MEIEKRHDLIRSRGLMLAGRDYLVHFIAPRWSRTLRPPMACRMPDHRFQAAVRRRQLPVSSSWGRGIGRPGLSELSHVRRGFMMWYRRRCTENLTGCGEPVSGRMASGRRLDPCGWVSSLRVAASGGQRRSLARWRPTAPPPRADIPMLAAGLWLLAWSGRMRPGGFRVSISAKRTRTTDTTSASAYPMQAPPQETTAPAGSPAPPRNGPAFVSQPLPGHPAHGCPGDGLTPAW